MIAYFFNKPIIYNLFQKFVGTKRAQDVVVDLLSLSKYDRVLDFGCGTGKYAKGFNGQYYLGIDPLEECIRVAKDKYRNNVGIVFLVGDEKSLSMFKDKEFDFIFGIGVLHHMEDSQISSLGIQIHRILGDSGQAVFFEPYFYEEQSLLTKIFIRLDRGQRTRTELGYFKLFEPRFKIIATKYKKLLNIPYDHIGIRLFKN